MKSFLGLLCIFSLTVLINAKSIANTKEDPIEPPLESEDADGDNEQIIVTVITPVVTTFAGDEVVGAQQERHVVARSEEQLKNILENLGKNLAVEKSTGDNNQIIITVITPVVTTFGGDDILVPQPVEQ